MVIFNLLNYIKIYLLTLYKTYHIHIFLSNKTGLDISFTKNTRTHMDNVLRNTV